MIGGAALAATVLLLAPTAPAEAGATAGDADDHALGSQIAAHEGGVLERAAPPTPRAGLTRGVDVSAHQRAVNWAAVAAGGARFAYVKATEGTTYHNRYFAQQYNGSYRAGLVRGAYHFALPDRSDGAAQANFFVDHGGGWSPDGRTLPPALDMEYNPYGDACYRMSPRDLVGWIRAFSERVRARTGRYPVIYTSTRWWARCTGNDRSLGGAHPLWIPRYGPRIGALPAGWTVHRIWQYANSGPLPGDQNYFNGDQRQLHAFALR
ncbi:lysozyme [Gandjariella thermophila]|nr:lysozyme [Gandjariella thermophila]